MKEQMTTKEAAENARAALEGINKSGGIFIYATKEWLELVIKALEAQAELEEQVAWVKDALENGEFEQSCKTCKHDNKPWYTEPCDSCISSYGVINGYERADVRENRTSERTGRWIDRSEGGRILYPWMESCECSKCGEFGSAAWDYCPHCGVAMMEEKE